MSRAPETRYGRSHSDRRGGACKKSTRMIASGPTAVMDGWTGWLCRENTAQQFREQGGEAGEDAVHEAIAEPTEKITEDTIKIEHTHSPFRLVDCFSTLVQTLEHTGPGRSLSDPSRSRCRRRDLRFKSSTSMSGGIPSGNRLVSPVCRQPAAIASPSEATSRGETRNRSGNNPRGGFSDGGVPGQFRRPGKGGRFPIAGWACVRKHLSADAQVSGDASDDPAPDADCGLWP